MQSGVSDHVESPPVVRWLLFTDQVDLHPGALGLVKVKLVMKGIDGKVGKYIALIAALIRNHKMPCVFNLIVVSGK